MSRPEALRLADLLCKDGHECCDFQAAAELRRLHAENERLQERRDALLLECIDIVALHGGSVEIEAAIRAKMGEANEQDYD